MQSVRSNNSFITIEDYNAEEDDVFIANKLVPYLSNLFDDLKMRSANNEKDPNFLDKVSFVEYTKLPGIINDRLHTLFSEEADREGTSVHKK